MGKFRNFSVWNGLPAMLLQLTALRLWEIRVRLVKALGRNAVLPVLYCLLEASNWLLIVKSRKNEAEHSGRGV
jgi:hypothetical protein